MIGLGIVMPAQAPPRRHVLIVVDGLRPDYVTAGVMPRLTAVGKRGVVFTKHHAVFPTVTRVNGASFATGAYPGAHGLMGNSVYFPRVDPARFLDTANRQQLSRIAAVEGTLLTVPTLAEILRQTGERMFVTSSGSPGSAMLIDPTAAGGAMVHPEFVIPETLRGAMAKVGEPPTGEAQPMARDRYAVDAFLKVGLPHVTPTVSVIWLGSLDATAHSKGIGSPDAVSALRHLDGEIGRIEDGLRAAGLLDAVNIWVSSDHGFSTHTGAVDIAAILTPFARTLSDGTPRIVASGGAIYVRDGDDDTVGGIVRGLQQTPGVGAIFTRAARPGSLDGHVAGTLSFDVVHWNHDRSAQILYSPDWTDAPNAHGVRGSVAAGGTAGHGSSSPWDVHNTLIAAGPDLGSGRRIDAPSANVDLMPTVLALLGKVVPSSVQGRILEEAFAGDRARAARRAVTTTEHTARTSDPPYAVTARLSILHGGSREYRYFDGTAVSREVIARHHRFGGAPAELAQRGSSVGNRSRPHAAARNDVRGVRLTYRPLASR